MEEIRIVVFSFNRNKTLDLMVSLGHFFRIIGSASKKNFGSFCAFFERVLLMQV